MWWLAVMVVVMVTVVMGLGWDRKVTGRSPVPVPAPSPSPHSHPPLPVTESHRDETQINHSSHSPSHLVLVLQWWCTGDSLCRLTHHCRARSGCWLLWIGKANSLGKGPTKVTRGDTSPLTKLQQSESFTEREKGDLCLDLVLRIDAVLNELRDFVAGTHSARCNGQGSTVQPLRISELTLQHSETAQ